MGKGLPPKKKTTTPTPPKRTVTPPSRTPAARQNVSQMPKFTGTLQPPQTQQQRWQASFGLAPYLTVKSQRPAPENVQRSEPFRDRFVQTSGLKPFGAAPNSTASPQTIEDAINISGRLSQARRLAQAQRFAQEPAQPEPRLPGWFYPGRLQELTAGTNYFPDVTRWEPGNIGPGINPSIITAPMPGGIDNQGRPTGRTPTIGDFETFFGDRPFNYWNNVLKGLEEKQRAAWPPPEFELPPFQGPPAPLPNESEVAMPAYTGPAGPEEWPYGGGGGGGGGGGEYIPLPKNWLQQLYSWRL